MTKLIKLLPCIGAIAIGIALLIRFAIFNTSGEKKIDVSTSLINAIDIAELSTAEFRYRGIADVYEDESRTKILCRVCYNSVVKAGINMKNVQFDVDNENKTVTATLPDIDLKVTIIDEESMSLLPSDADVSIENMLRYSREDVENEAKQSEALMNTAKDNLKAIIEGLLYPILKAQEYVLIWD